ncbi:ComEA family DNA-binding protein [Vibrio ulleungensis]|uniref:Helix-hairpin-helix domain-containing protein n=1 Tax=Vibrio ulleungensis TaxID=2807619 RepID=A0ABS2HH51_9VIBR|nr:ComEA family DNA-binding protein [Vibrio ulleungensis]MBM7036354.1 helix-hairpin-helix domain-containing protein [Vibrio ulleungensis]
MTKTLSTIWLTLLALFSVGCFAAQETESQNESVNIVVNINQADAEELATLLQGIGLKKAQNIIEYRTVHGPFTSADQLTNVSGIGAATVDKNRQRIAL